MIRAFPRDSVDRTAQRGGCTRKPHLIKKIMIYTAVDVAARIQRHHESRENPLGTDVQEPGGAQKERLVHLDFRLFFLGEVSRADISGRFDVAPAVATRDLARYRALAPGNIRFDGSSKTCRRAAHRFRQRCCPPYQQSEALMHKHHNRLPCPAPR